MSEVSRKVSILLNMELDQKVSKDAAEEIANRLEAVPSDELWAALLEEAGVDANVIAVDAEVVEIQELDEIDDEADDDRDDDAESDTPNDPED